MTTDKILDIAIQKMRSGSDISVVVSEYPAESQAQLRAMLEIISIVSSLPRKEVPIPTKRRLYLQHSPERTSVFGIFTSFRLVPAALAAFLLVITGTAFAAQSSLPGDKLFAVKKSYESLQVKLATNPEKRADLQLQIAAQRFQDAQKVLSQDNNDATKKVAIDELNTQTAVALNDIKNSAVALAASNPNIVKKAEDLTKDQTNLISKVDPKIADSGVVKKNQETKVTIHDIKKIIAAANEESGAAIIPDEVITTNGTITSVKDQSIRIGKNEFTVTDDTLILDSDHNTLKLSDLTAGQDAKVEAKIVDSKNVIETLTITVKPVEKPPVKETPKPKDPIILKEKPKETKIEPLPAEADIPSPVQTNDTFGGFIAEPPISSPGASQ